MNRWSALAVVLVVASCGCSSTLPRTKIVLDPVGPRGAGPRAAPVGYLRVYSATEDRPSGQLPYQVHTPYWVFNDHGKQVRGVVNHVGETDQAPMLVKLAPGRYRVVAEAAGYGQVTVPVVVAGGMLTEVVLDRNGLPHVDGVPETELVRLPEGPAVGFRAREPAKPKPTRLRRSSDPR